MFVRKNAGSTSGLAVSSNILIGFVVLFIGMSSSISNALQQDSQVATQQAIQKLKTIAMAAEKEHGKDAKQTLIAQQELAMEIAISGDLAGAEQIFVDIVGRMEKNFGGQDPDTQSCKKKLARVYLERGKTAKGIELAESVLKDQVELHGAESMDVVKTRNMLIAEYDNIEEYGKAESELLETIRVLEELKGEDHLNTLMNKKSLATILMRRKKYTESESLCRSVLQTLAKDFGEDHVQTLMVRRNLAVLLNEIDRFDEAVKEFQTAYAGFVSTLGASHRESLDTAIIFAGKLSKRKMFRQAAVIRLDVLQTLLKQISPDSREIADHRLKLIEDLEAGGDFGAAAQQQVQLLGTYVKRVGMDHPDVVRHRVATVTNLMKANDFFTAELMLKDLLKYYINKDGVEAESVFFTQLAHTKALIGQEKFPEAEASGMELVKLAKKLLPPESEDFAEANITMSRAYSGNKKFDEAIALLKEVLDQQVTTHGKHHRLAIGSRFLIALVKLERGETELAVKSLETILAQQMEFVGAESLDVINTRNKLAGAYIELSNLPKAKEQYQNIIKIHEKTEGPHGFKTLQAKGVLGFVLSADANHKEAEQVYRDCLAGWQKLEGNGPNSRNAYRLIAGSLSGQGQNKEAEKMFRELLGELTKSNINGTEKFETQGMLAVSLKRLGKLEEAKKLMQSSYDFFLKNFGAEHFKTKSLAESLKDLNDKTSSGK